MIRVEVKGVSITDIGFVVFLKNSEDERILPIFIGPVEAQAITTVKMKRAPQRPMTHDLLKSFLDAVEYDIIKTEITEYKGPVFYSNIYIQHRKFIGKKSDKSLLIIDARPSDAIALSLRTETPIFVSKEIFDEHGIILDEKNAETKTDLNQSSEKERISKKTNEQLGIYEKMLEDAIKEERFEDAGKIKEQIDILTGNIN